MRKANNDVPPSELEQFYDTIFGSDYEVDDQLANEILTSHNIDSSELIDEFKLRLQAELRQGFQETGKVDKTLEGTLHSIRKKQQELDPAPVKAEPWIDGLLSGSNSTAGSHVLFSFHKQKEGEVSTNDKTILDELERELGKE